MLYKSGLIHYFWPTGRLIICLMTLVIFPSSSGTGAEFAADGRKARGQILNRYKCSVLPQAKPGSRAAPLLLSGLFSRLHPDVALVWCWCQSGWASIHRPVPQHCLWHQGTSKICHMIAAGESVLFLQLPLPLAAGINLVEETRVMFGNYFVSSFINQVSAEWLSPGELCKGHEGFA